MLKHKRFALGQARTYYKNPVKSSPVQETGDDLTYHPQDYWILSSF